MRPRPNLDVLERLVFKHDGMKCDQPCDGCELAAEVIALLRLVRFVTETHAMQPDDDADLYVDLHSVKDPVAWHEYIASKEAEIRAMASSDEAAEILLARLRGRL